MWTQIICQRPNIPYTYLTTIYVHISSHLSVYLFIYLTVSRHPPACAPSLRCRCTLKRSHLTCCPPFWRMSEPAVDNKFLAARRDTLYTRQHVGYVRRESKQLMKVKRWRSWALRRKKLRRMKREECKNGRKSERMRHKEEEKLKKGKK